ncbi:MAG: right-handed parallel beta-helix repeat-containing protein [Anaerovoracaceae bacterium]
MCAITVDVEAITLGIGETVTITATVEPSNATRKTVTWSTSDANVATVDNGVVTAVGEGETTITATAGGKTAEVVVTVLPIVTGEDAAELLDWFVGWPTLRFHSEERGNYVGYDFKLKVGEISDLSDVTVSIFKEGIKIATNTLKNPSNYNGTELTGSFYTNDIEKTSSWYVEQISGALGEDIFDKLVLRAIYDETVYIVDQAELRSIEGNVKNLTQYKGYGTIQAAIADAADGDVIVVQGVYDENLNITKPITLKGIESGTATIKGNIVINKTNNVTIEGLEVEATDTTAPVIHMIDSDDVNIINNTVIAQGYASIGTSTGPARVTGKISGNTVTGMIIVGTDGVLEVNDNKVTPTDTSSEGICFYPVGSTAEITVKGNTVGPVTKGNVQIKVNEKPTSVNGATTEAEMLAAITADNAGATAQLSWVKTVGAIGADFITIQGAVNAATPGDNFIVVFPGNYGTASIDIIQREGVNITLEAVGEVVLKNQIQIDGNGRSEGEETLSVKGFTFDFSDKSGDIITTVKGDDQNYGYTHNVSIEDCIFIGNTQSSVVAVRASALGGHYNFRLKGCTGTNLHSLAQLTSVTGVKVQDCNVIDAIEGGLNLQNSTNIVIDNLTVDGTEYGVRAGQGSGTVNTGNTMTISDSNLNAQYPIWLRGDAPGIVIITDSTLTASEDGEMIYNKANGNVNITIDGAAYVTSDAELAAALADTTIKTIILEGTFDGFTVERGVKIEGGTINVGSIVNMPGNIPKGIYIKTNEAVEIDGVSFDGGSEGHAQRKGIVTETGYSPKVTITRSTFMNLPLGIYFNSAALGSIEGNTFSAIGYAAIGIDSDGSVTISGNNISNAPVGVEIFGKNVTVSDDNVYNNVETPVDNKSK